MRPRASRSTASAAGVLEGMERVLAEEQPDRVVVEGRLRPRSWPRPSPPSTPACRSRTSRPGCARYDLDHPFPEEANRRIATVLASIHFAPTD